MADCISERFNSTGPLVGLILGAFVCFGASTKPAPGKVTAIRFWSLGDVTRVAIEVSSEFRYKSERLSNPDRLFFDVLGAKPEMVSKGTHVIAVGDGLIKQIRVAETQPGVTRVVLDLDRRAEFTASQLSNPDRLMIELSAKDRPLPPASGSVTGATRLTDPPARTPAADLISAATLPAPEPSTPERRKPEPRKFEPPPQRAQALRTETRTEIISPPSLPIASKPSKPPSVLTASTSTVRRDIPPPPGDPVIAGRPIGDQGERLSAGATASAHPAKRTATGDRSLTRVLGLKLGRVVIDPGHGGHDVGTHGPSGLYEKDVVLDVSRRLGALIEARLGSEVIYTRSGDNYVGLEERTRIANDHQADLFLSIHANSSPLRTAAGVETYYLNFTTSKAALDVAARENASSERSIHDLKDLLQQIALKDKIDESREFATRLQTSLYSVETKGNGTAKNRGIKKAPFVVLIGASMPSVLAEIGFLTNSGDEALLRKSDHRQKLAEALYRGVSNYADTLSHFQVAQKRD